MSAPPEIHASAFVDAGAIVGPGTRIWHGSHVMGTAKIGRDCMLGQNVFVGPRVEIRDGCRIQNNVCLFEGVVLEDGVFVGPSATFTNVMRPRAGFPRKDRFEPTLVRAGATIGANATILCGITIGRGAFVAAGAVVTRAVPDFVLVRGVPARPAGFVCLCGEDLGPHPGGPHPNPRRSRVGDPGGGRLCGGCGRRYESRGVGLAEIT